MKVAVLGNGQLGAMLLHAGQRIGIDVQMLDIESDMYPSNDAVVTIEREHWPVNSYTKALQQHPNWLNHSAIFRLANRIRQKKLLDELNVATAPWYAPDKQTTQNELHALLGPDIFLKMPRGLCPFFVPDRHRTAHSRGNHQTHRRTHKTANMMEALIIARAKIEEFKYQSDVF